MGVVEAKMLSILIQAGGKAVTSYKVLQKMIDQDCLIKER